MTSKDQKLSILDKVGYAFGDGASNLFWMTFIYFQSNFYTDVFFYTPDAALERTLLEKLAALLLLTRVFDMAFDLFMGVMGDRNPHALGQVSSLPALVCRSLRHHQRADFYHPRVQPEWKADLRLHHAVPDDDGLLRNQYPVLGVDGRHLARFAGAHRRLVLPLCLCVWGRSGGSVFDALPGGLLRKSQAGDERDAAGRGQGPWLSIDDGNLRHCGGFTVLPDLRSHARAGAAVP